MLLMPSAVVAGAALAASTLLFICLWLHHPRHLFDKVMINTYVCLWNFRPNYSLFSFFFFLPPETLFYDCPFISPRHHLWMWAGGSFCGARPGLQHCPVPFSESRWHVFLSAQHICNGCLLPTLSFFEEMHSFCNEWEGVPNSFMHRKDYTVFK